ncbi:epidermal growth factor receptor kinase substrate 8-like protein 3b isoform X2 [Cynoglossus semilaevis]|uniref:epidermal growth factor receptor kinase substrate 8-like protein 3b isoform X2 n=1 Tax=Cynoglossus semilaevis TaxID=244447 RepID=UPI0007DC913A|nr:epidermal growth factor receptor kinase substrate 8-like isoform X2 [Cynoglossus semilaevis]
MYGNTSRFTYSPRASTQEDFPQQRRPLQHDEHRSSLQRDGLSRPSGRYIYMQRKDYSENLNRQAESLHVRVEHLFTCELDGLELKRIEDCVAKLKRLEAKGRLWPQEMIMEAMGGHLLLSDIESKTELETLPLSSITQTNAVLDSCAYNSLLIIIVQDRRKRSPQVFMFQCEEVKADQLKTELDKVAQRTDGNVDPHWGQSDIRNNLENLIGQHSPGGFPPDHNAMGEVLHNSDHRDFQILPPAIKVAVKKTDLFNRVIADLETFLGQVSVSLKSSSQVGKSKKMKNAPAHALPPPQEYIACLQKVKYGINLLVQLKGALKQPTVPDFLHIIFTCLGMMLPHYPPQLPPSVVSPLLTDAAHQLLEEVLTPEEKKLWAALGESWMTPSSRWPYGQVLPYSPVFYDGWQPPSPLDSPQLSRSSSQRFPVNEPTRESVFGDWNSKPAPSNEPPQLMRVMYNFVARNNKELSLMKDDVVQVIQKSKQWWLVRNGRGEEGSVPQNVLEPAHNNWQPDDRMDARGPVTLDMSSTPAEVKAWLQYKGFSKITVSCLGVLNGKLLLGMTKDEIRTVCPEEGAKVFFQLQAVKSSIALASEPSGPYNNRYY